MASNLDTAFYFPPPQFPIQGNWTEADYFRVEANKFIELVNGHIEVLPMPTWLHQRIVLWLTGRLIAWTEGKKGIEAILAPLPLKLFPGTIREPDILLLQKPQGAPRPRYPDSALMVVEVVSDGTDARNRDLIEKPADYAKASIPEYWIVDPIEKTVTVLKLENGAYTLHGRFEKEQTATAATLHGFSINCGEIWALENEI